MQGTRNLAHRMGRWSGTHPKTAIFGWIAFVPVAFFVGNSRPKHTLDEADTGVGESGRAAKVARPGVHRLRAARQGDRSSSRAAAGTLADADIRGRRRRRHLAPSGDRRRGRDRGGRALRRTVAPLACRSPSPATPRRRPPSCTDRRRDEAVAAAPPWSSSRASATPRPASSSTTSSPGLPQGRDLSIPITLVILILAFGALARGGHPGAARPLVRVRLVRPAALRASSCRSPTAPRSVMMLIGMAVGVDYSLFYLKREREERAKGTGTLAALEAAAATSGRAVLVSGFTVMASLPACSCSAIRTFSSMAIGSILVVAVAVLGSLTILPAVLVKLGHRVHKSRVPLLRGCGKDVRLPRLGLGPQPRPAPPARRDRARRRRPARPGRARDAHEPDGHRCGGPLPQGLPGHEDVRQADQPPSRPRPGVESSSRPRTSPPRR